MITTSGTGGVPEQIHVVSDAVTALEAVIVLHSTALGPAVGGCRLWSYPSRDAAAIDACRLAAGMSYKNALAGLPFGGGKAVIRRPSDSVDRAALFEAFGRAVAALGGSYVTAEDVGTGVADMSVVARQTRYVAGLPPASGQVGGDPSPWTARGVFVSMRDAAEWHLGRTLADCTVAIQGVGNVGAALARLLHAAGARLIIADVDSAVAARLAVETGADLASVDAIAAAKADVFAPCALGGILNHRTVGKLNARLVCGAANNQLGEAEDAARLADRGILYTPDFVVNAGGIINVAAEYLNWSAEQARRRVEETSLRLAKVLEHADRTGASTHVAAETLAWERIAAGSLAARAAA